MAEPTGKQKIGRLGEDIAAKFLESKGFTVIACNYLKKYGEIDIIAKKGGILHFVEVKTVSHENFSSFLPNPMSVSHETDDYRAEDNLHPQKLKRLARTIQVYLLENSDQKEVEWQFHAVTVRIDQETRRARVKFLENIIL